jgi:hypothetical protein
MCWQADKGNLRVGNDVAFAAYDNGNRNSAAEGKPPAFLNRTLAG